MFSLVPVLNDVQQQRSCQLMEEDPVTHLHQIGLGLSTRTCSNSFFSPRVRVAAYHHHRTQKCPGQHAGFWFQSMDHFDDIGPSVVMASPGMMQSGLSRELFESWCTDKRNGVIIAGYCVEGTLAKVIQLTMTGY